MCYEYDWPTRVLIPFEFQPVQQIFSMVLNIHQIATIGDTRVVSEK